LGVVRGILKLWFKFEDYAKNPSPRANVRQLALRVEDYLETPFPENEKFFRRNQVSRSELWTEVLGETRSTLRSNAKDITKIMNEIPGWMPLSEKQLHRGEVGYVFRRLGATSGKPTPVDAPPIVDTIEPARDIATARRDIATARRKRFEL
jgi:hypothetical protein